MRSLKFIFCLYLVFFSSCKVQDVMSADEDKLKRMFQLYTDASIRGDFETYLSLTDEAIFSVVSKEKLENKFANRKEKAYNNKSTITDLRQFKNVKEVSGNYYMLLLIVSDDENLAEGKTFGNKGDIIVVSRDQGNSWKFISGKYFSGFGETENGLGLINKHPEVLPQEVWDHFYRKLDPKTYK